MADQEIKITAGPSKDMLIGGVFFGVHDRYTFVLDGESVEATLRMIGPGDTKRETFEVKFSVYATGRWYEGLAQRPNPQGQGEAAPPADGLVLRIQGAPVEQYGADCRR